MFVVLSYSGTLDVQGSSLQQSLLFFESFMKYFQDANRMVYSLKRFEFFLMKMVWKWKWNVCLHWKISLIWIKICFRFLHATYCFLIYWFLTICGCPIIWCDHTSCGATRNGNNCIKIKMQYLISEPKILISDWVCWRELYCLDIFFTFV